MSFDITRIFTGMDSSGASTSKVDTYLEYQALGNYLNGSYSFTINYEKQYDELEAKDQTKLQQLYKAAKEFFSKMKPGENLPQITEENALKYADIERTLSWREEDGDFGEADKTTLKNIRMALNKFLAANGVQSIDEEATDIKNHGNRNISKDDFEFVMRDIDIENDTFDYNYTIEELLKDLKTNKENEIKKQKSLTFLSSPYDNKKLKEYAQQYIKENNIPKLDSTDREVDLGNGKFDKAPVQKDNVCWALAGINSLLSTEEGKQLLESNLYYDKETGVFTIHLQEAEDNGLHDGIYVVTPEDIIKEGGELVEGEGDAAAYLIAIKHYFAEVNQNPELADKMESEDHTTRNVEDGNYGFRFFEIMTGGSHAEYNSSEGVKVQDGIGTGLTNKLDFDMLKNIVENKKGCVTMVIADHSISVVGFQDGKFLIQESNNYDNFAEDYMDTERNHHVFEKTDSINGRPTFTLSQDDFEGYIRAVSYLKWEE